MRPTRETVEGRAYLDLQNQARRDMRPTDELFARYALEGFLARLAASPAATSLVLKGGVLLAAFGARQPTRDVDLHAEHVSSDAGSVLVLIRSIAAIELRPLTYVLAGYAELAQNRYQAWRRKNRREELPEHFHDLLTQVIAFADPVVSGGAAQLNWRASSGAWG